MNAKSQLVVDNVSKSFGPAGASVAVLESFSADIHDGEFVALLGPSGCGKSTLLRIINGLSSVDTGRILLGGNDVTGRPGLGRGMVFQGADLFPWRTALDNVAFGLQMLDLSKSERKERARHHLAKVGLSAFEDAYPHQMSGGMQQRVGIARAFAIEPQLLLMDEPFGALDVQTRDVMQDELLSLWTSDPKTVIFVTHGIEEALYLADRIMVFSPRPARLVAEIKSPFPRPRMEDIKGDRQFIELRQEIGALLRHTVVH